MWDRNKTTLNFSIKSAQQLFSSQLLFMMPVPTSTVTVFYPPELWPGL